MRRARRSAEAFRFAMQSVQQARWIALVSIAAVLAASVLPRAGSMLLVPVLAVDLVISLGGFQPIEASKGDPSLHYAGDAGTRFMQTDTDAFRVADLDPRNAGMIFTLEAAQGYHTVQTWAYAQIQPFLDFRNPTARSLYNLANIKYQQSRSDISAYNFKEAAPGVWLNQEALPRAFFVGRCRGFSSTDEMTRYVLSRSIQPSRELMLLASDCRPDVGAAGACELRSTVETGERYTADCTVGEGGGWAFFSVLQYPGWTSTVDGREAKLVPADIAFYAVPLGAGRHHVELVYRSRALRYGLGIAGVTGLLALGLAGRSVRARRRTVDR